MNSVETVLSTRRGVAPVVSAVARGGEAIGRGAVSLGRLQVNCDRHGPYMSHGMTVTAARRKVWSACPICRSAEVLAEQQLAAEERERQVQARERERIEAAIEHAAIPKKFADCTFDSYEPQTEKQDRAKRAMAGFVGNWELTRAKGRWLVMVGPTGVGKSHLACAGLRTLMPRWVGQYITVTGMIQAIRSTWHRGAEIDERSVLRHFGATPLLVLDEVGVQYGTDAEKVVLFEILDRRYRDVLPTVLLSNEKREGVKHFLGGRLYDRMTEVAGWVELDGSSYRPTARGGAK